MNNSSIRVTIGIPTYNRALMLQKALDSAIAQDYQEIEILVSDNCSSDETKVVCEKYLKMDDRIKYIRQLTNIGATANFGSVLQHATGEYFMWLGDDDSIDSSYISSCLAILEIDQCVALVSGSPKYYKSNEFVFDGRCFDLLQPSWMARVLTYYWKVTDNGMYYGVMRTKTLKKTVFPNIMAGDWHLLANIISTGKVIMLNNISVHRSIGGATESYQKIAKSLGLPAIQAVFPTLTAAYGAWVEIMFRGSLFRRQKIIERALLAVGVFFVLVIKKLYNTLARIKRGLMKLYLVLEKKA